MSGARVPPSDVRVEFKTKEGNYRNLKPFRYSKPRGLPLLGRELSKTCISIVSVKDMQGLSEWILFNSGREFYCYPFYATEKAPDLTHPVDKHVYRTSYPLSHDVNLATRSVDSLDLVIGFNGGPLQHINPITKAALGIYNSDRHLDPTDVTCVRWVPGSETNFVSSHMSGNLYTWTTEHHHKTSNLPTFSLHKDTKDTNIYVSKPRNRFPVVNRWTIGHGPITAFAFSPDTTHIAVASQDGFLRIYNFHKMELYSRMRSYYGGFLCACWSPDGKYVVAGGEDDLVSVWSFDEKRVVTRGEGHHSYVNAVSFDPYISETDTLQAGLDSELASSSLADLKSRGSRFFEDSQSYRVGSVGQDGLMCLWELSGDNLTIQRRGHSWSRSRLTMTKQSSSAQYEEEEEGEEKDKRKSEAGSRVSTQNSVSEDPVNDEGAPESSIGGSSVTGNKMEEKEGKDKKKKSRKKSSTDSTAATVEMKDPLNTETVSDGETSSVASDSTKVKKKKKPLVKSAFKKVKNLVSGQDTAVSPRHFISPFESCHSDDIAPKMSDINVVEPLVCKKVWSERLTDIVFREDCLLIATEDGYVHLWVRPGRLMMPEESAVAGHLVPSNPGLNSPKPGAANDPEMKHTSV